MVQLLELFEFTIVFLPLPISTSIFKECSTFFLAQFVSLSTCNVLNICPESIHTCFDYLIICCFWLRVIELIIQEIMDIVDKIVEIVELFIDTSLLRKSLPILSSLILKFPRISDMFHISFQFSNLSNVFFSVMVVNVDFMFFFSCIISEIMDSVTNMVDVMMVFFLEVVKMVLGIIISVLPHVHCLVSV